MVAWFLRTFGADRTRTSRRVVSLLTALVLATGSVPAARAYGIEHGSATWAGSAAMLNLRIPLGGEWTALSQPTVGLSFGSTWRGSPGAVLPGGYRFVAGAELGMTLNGDPIVRLGSYTSDPRRLNAAITDAQGESFCGRNLGICIVAGVAIVALVVSVAIVKDATDDGY